MKAANFVNVLLAVALVILCAELHAERNARRAGTNPPAENAAEPARAEGAERTFHAEPGEGSEETAPAKSFVVDSTGLAPGVSGFGGPVPVTVEVTDGVVARVAPKLPNDETPAFFDRLEAAGLWKAWDGLPVEVAATARVDAVTSATYSSEAAIANVRAALSAAAGAAETGPAPSAP